MNEKYDSLNTKECCSRPQTTLEVLKDKRTCLIKAISDIDDAISFLENERSEYIQEKIQVIINATKI